MASIAVPVAFISFISGDLALEDDSPQRSAGPTFALVGRAVLSAPVNVSSGGKSTDLVEPVPTVLGALEDHGPQRSAGPTFARRRSSPWLAQSPTTDQRGRRQPTN